MAQVDLLPEVTKFVEAPAESPAMVEALAEVSEHATFTRLLGSYASAPRR